MCAKANCFDYIVNASQESYLEESKLSGNQEKLLDAWKDYTLVYFPIVDRNQYEKDSIGQIQRTINSANNLAQIARTKTNTKKLLIYFEKESAQKQKKWTFLDTQERKIVPASLVSMELIADCPKAQ